jgi:hypothetical protein
MSAETLIGNLLSQINQAEAAATSGTAVKPVLIPDQ